MKATRASSGAKEKPRRGMVFRHRKQGQALQDDPTHRVVAEEDPLSKARVDQRSVVEFETDPSGNLIDNNFDKMG